MIEATIEYLAFTIRSSRETIGDVPQGGTLYNLFLLRNQFGNIGCPQMGRPHIDGEDVLSTTLLKNKRSGQAREQRLEWKQIGS